MLLHINFNLFLELTRAVCGHRLASLAKGSCDCKPQGFLGPAKLGSKALPKKLCL